MPHEEEHSRRYVDRLVQIEFSNIFEIYLRLERRDDICQMFWEQLSVSDIANDDVIDMHEQDIEKFESKDPVQSEGRKGSWEFDRMPLFKKVHSLKLRFVISTVSSRPVGLTEAQDGHA
ncbi:hypothetical protein TNCV_4604471 [Trichonephila clavipes]|nr:hypothetical protein TNCV_4604471 [Trichonephila clavipes]